MGFKVGSRNRCRASTTCKQRSGNGHFNVSGLTRKKTDQRLPVLFYPVRRVMRVCRFQPSGFPFQVWTTPKTRPFSGSNISNVEKDKSLMLLVNPNDSAIRRESHLQDEKGQGMRHGALPYLSLSSHGNGLRSSAMENERYYESSPIHVLEASLSRSKETNTVHQNGTPAKAETSSANSRAVSNCTRFFKLWKAKTRKRLPSLPVPKLYRKSKSEKDNPRFRDLYSFKSSLANFNQPEIQDAMNNFSDENLIGKGGYADVFKGRLKDGRHVAIKRLTKGTPDEQASAFLYELGIIAHLDHPNIAKICDFGISKWLPKEVEHCNVSKFEGTFGYFAPEYFMHGIVNEKTDVYAFGVLLLELITGRRVVDDLQQSVVLWAKPLLDNNYIKELLDPTLAGDYDFEEVDHMVLTISLCIEQSPLLRPQMSQ